jgi:hypothetical protein
MLDTKAKNTHSEYVKLIAFALRLWQHERAAVLRYTYISCLVLQGIADIWQREGCHITA